MGICGMVWLVWPCCFLRLSFRRVLHFSSGWFLDYSCQAFECVVHLYRLQRKEECTFSCVFVDSRLMMRQCRHKLQRNFSPSWRCLFRRTYQWHLLTLAN